MIAPIFKHQKHHIMIFDTKATIEILYKNVQFLKANPEKKRYPEQVIDLLLEIGQLRKQLAQEKSAIRVGND